VVWVCAWCNRHKGAQPLDVWLASPVLHQRQWEVRQWEGWEAQLTPEWLWEVCFEGGS